MPKIKKEIVEKPKKLRKKPEIKPETKLETKLETKPILEAEEISLEDFDPAKMKSENYLEAIGRRKTAVARVRLWTKGDKIFLVNQKPFEQYFQDFELRQVASSSLEKMKASDKFKVEAKVTGGGIRAQAEAVRHGIARALVLFNADFRKRLKKAGYLIRDPRMRERKKFGLRRARRAPQWAKR